MSSAVEPAIVLAAYAESAVHGRRVLFIGPARSALPARLVERGARLVHVCDPDPVRLGEAQAKNRAGSISFSALAEGHFALRDGAFDVCIVEDMGISDAAPLLRKIKRALQPRGLAILVSPNAEVQTPLLARRSSGADALDYYALYDAAKAEFEHVRMLGQAPFVGYVVAEFAPEGSPEPSLDTAFVPGGAEEPELFLAVASQQPLDLEAFSVIQLPYRSVVAGDGAQDGDSAQDGDALRRSRSAEQAAQSKLAALEAELAAERQATSTRESQLREAEARAAAREAELSTVRQELEGKRQELEGKRRELESNRRELESNRREVESKNQALEGKSQALEDKSQALEKRNRELESTEQQLRAAQAALQELEAKQHELAAKQHELAAEDAGANASELLALETALRERGEHIRQLERELREAERIGKELLRQLPASPTAPAPAQPDAASLAQKLAKSQADLIATRWALEAAVRRSPTGETPEA